MKTTLKKIPVGVLGATGMVGQQYLQMLADHPWFEPTFLASSEQSAGKMYAEAIAGRMQGAIAERFLKMPVFDISDIAAAKRACRFVFSAVTSEAAKMYEERYAEAGIPVVSNVSYHRQTVDVPVLIPEVNPEHLEIISLQKKNRNWTKGFIVTKPNCSIQSYMIPLAPLHHQFQVKKISVTTLQAISGAGFPGVASLDMIDNVIPYIAHEEEKSEQEPLKIWGKVDQQKIDANRDIQISAHCNRVPVVDGHMACVSVQFARKPTREEVIDLWNRFQGLPQQLKLPSAPATPIIYKEEKDRPQSRHDRLAGNGMSVTVGRLRECSLFDYRFVALSHNTIRGAAGGGILNAELLVQQGYLGDT